MLLREKIMNIQFLKDTSTAVIPEEFQGDDVIMVYRDGYALPDVEVSAKIEFARYKVTYPSYSPTKMILVGLNKIILPSNRCDLVFEYLQDNSHSIDKMSIDTAPFVKEPWRFWFHHSMTKNNVWNWPHSFFVETMWKHWFERQSETCNVSPSNLLECTKAVYSDLDKLESSFHFFQPDQETIDLYEASKEAAFAKFSTFKSLYGTILKNLKVLHPMDVSFEAYLKNGEMHYPDLPIYRFVADENMRRQQMYNACIGA